MGPSAVPRAIGSARRSWTRASRSSKTCSSSNWSAAWARSCRRHRGLPSTGEDAARVSRTRYLTTLLCHHRSFDYSEYFSYKRDDGVSWIPQSTGSTWGPAQSLVNSHVHTYSRLAAALRASGSTKAMLGNCNTLCRIDLAGLFDGGFSEGAALNAVAWLGMRRPSILWTYSLDGHSAAALDAYFQQHALMRVFPMAPMPANDHSINPGPAQVQQAYNDYAPIFTALRGAEWVLDAVRPVSSSPAVGQLINVFRSMGTSDAPAAPGELLAVVMLGGNATSTQVTVVGASLFGSADSVSATALVPGASQTWQPLGVLPVQNGSVVVPAVPMARGCSLLRLVPAGGAQ